MNRAQINKLQKQITKRIDSAKKNELPKNNRPRNGEGIPLSSWMGWTKADSKILDLVNGNVLSRNYTLRECVERLAERIANRYPMTDIQYIWLLNLLLSKYRGWIKEREPDYPKSVYVTGLAQKLPVYETVYGWERGRAAKVPLSEIISGNMTNDILVFVCATVAKGVEK